MAAVILRLQETLKKIDSSKLFQGAVITVILLSALLIGAKTHNLPENILSILVLLDFSVTIFFVIEIVIRFLAVADKKSFFRMKGNSERYSPIPSAPWFLASSSKS